MMASDSDEELDQEVADGSDEELDPEMAEDHEENVPGLEELIEEMFGSDEREELEAVMDPAEAEIHFDRKKYARSVRNLFVIFTLKRSALFVFRIYQFSRFSASSKRKTTHK